MTLDSVIKDIVEIPEKFNSLGNISYTDLVKQSGYLGFTDQVTEEKIQKFLIDNPKYVDEWQQWSENKRTSSGWYLETKDAAHIVGYYPSNSGEPQKVFGDKKAACAYFIAMELDDMRLRLLKS